MKQWETSCVCIFKNLEELEKEVHLKKACEPAGFLRRVSFGMHYKSLHDVNDSFAGTTAAFREYTSTRESKVPRSPYGSKDTPKLDQSVLQVNTTCCLDMYGLEMQIPSTTGDGS